MKGRFALLGALALATTAFTLPGGHADAWMSAAHRTHGAGALLFGLMGLAYLGRREFMPYHAQALGQRWDELPASARALFLASMRIIGSAWLGLSIALGLMLRHGFHAEQAWAVYGTPAVGLTVAVPTLLGVLYVKRNTPAAPPWPPLAVAVALFALGLVFSLIAGRMA